MARKIKKRTINSKLDALASPISESMLRPSAGRDKKIGEFYYIDLDSLEPYPGQARKVFNKEELEGLADTIQKHGVRQPLTVSKNPEELGRYYIISGERRAKASRISGLTRVPCIVLSDTDNEKEIALVENVQRKDLHPLEIAEALKETLKNTTDSQEKLAKSLGLSRTYITETMGFLRLPENVKTLLLERDLTKRSIYRRLLKCNNELAMLRMLGAEKLVTNSGRKRNVLSFYIDNGECHLKKGKARLSQHEKKQLIENVERFLNELKNEFSGAA